MSNAAPSRAARGRSADAQGRWAEDRAATALVAEGWRVLGRRLRTASGEVDLVVERLGLVAFVEVKARRRLAEAASSLTSRQQARLAGAAAILLASHPTWGQAGVRFDVVVVDAAGQVRRITDAFRPD